MANADQYSGGQYLKPADITEPSSMKIESVLESVDYNNNPCLVLLFEDGRKLQLNKTNVGKLKEIFKSSDTDDWENKEIGISPGTYEFEGKTGPTIVVTASDDLPF